MDFSKIIILYVVTLSLPNKINEFKILVLSKSLKLGTVRKMGYTIHNYILHILCTCCAAFEGICTNLAVVGNVLSSVFLPGVGSVIDQGRCQVRRHLDFLNITHHSSVVVINTKNNLIHKS